MDSQKFDELIKSMGTARVTRLTALRGLAGGALAAVAGVAIATDEAEAGRKGRKAKRRKSKKRRSRSSKSVAPVYNAPVPAPKTPEKPAEKPIEQPKCEAEYCAKGQEWSYDTCACECERDGYAICESTYDEYAYLKGTCVDTHCENDYDTYNRDTCKCGPIVCDNVYDCGAYGTWDKKTCSCTCDDYSEVCTSDTAYDQALYGTCVYTKCDGYESEYFTYEPSKCACVCNAPAYERKNCGYGYTWSDADCHCIPELKPIS